MDDIRKYIPEIKYPYTKHFLMSGARSEYMLVMDGWGIYLPLNFKKSYVQLNTK